MADRPPWLDYQAPQGVTVPLGPRDPYKSAAEARAERADTRAAAADARAQADFESKNTMVAPPGDTAKTGEEYLATLPRSLAGQVKALADGRRAFPTGAALRSPSVQELIAAATQYDPTLDAANAATRVKTRTNFTSGKARQNMTAINTALGHLGTLWDRAQKLENRSAPVWNAIANRFETETGDKRVKDFNFAKQAVVDELTRVFKGSGGNLTEVLEWQKQLSSSSSPEQLRGVVGTAVELLHSRLEALSQEYSGGMGRSADPIEFLTPHSQKVFNALGPGGDGKVPPEPKNGGGTPPILGGEGPGAGPPSDELSLATGDTQTSQQRGPVEKKLAAMLASRTPSANIRAYAKANDFPSGKVESVLAWRAMNPKYRGPYDVSTEVIRPTTAWNRAAASPLAAGAASAADAALAGFGDEAVGAVNALRSGEPLSDAIRSADFSKQMLLNANPKSALAGSVLGGIGGMAAGGAGLKVLGIGKAGWLAANPIKAAALGDTAYGTAFGAGENNDNRLLGAGVGMVTAPIASFAGQGAVKAGGKLLTGVVNPAVDRLRAASIPLTVGEVLGGGWKKAQDAMTSVFGPGNMVARRYEEGRRALNEAAFNAAGEPIGAPINAVGQEGVTALNAAKNQAYSNALDPVQLDLNTPETVQALQSAITAAKGIPNVDQASDLATGALANYVGNAADEAGQMSGRDFQQAYRGLSRTARAAAPRMYGHEIGEALGQGQDALVGALQEQNPGAFQGFLNAHSANRHLSILNDALNAAQNQISDAGEQLFTPAQLGRAATNNARTYSGKVAAASGGRPFNQLALDAQQIMSSKLGDSGTQARLAAMRLATGAGLATAGGGVGYGANGGEGAVEGAAIPLAALTVLGTRRGQQLLTAALLKRVAPFRIAGRAAIRNPQVGGDILTAAGIPLLTGQ